MNFQHPTAQRSGGEQPLTITRDGKFLLSGGIEEPYDWTDETGISHSVGYPICVYDIGSGKLAATYFGHSASVSCVAEADDGTLMASGESLGVSPSIILWDKQKLVPKLKIRNSEQSKDVGFHNIVNCLAFAKDGTHLYASGDVSIRAFDSRTGALERKIDVPNASGVPEILVCPDGERVIARLQPRGREPGALQIWDTKTGVSLQTLRANAGSLSTLDGTNSIAQSRDGHLLICAGKSGLVHVFTATPKTTWEKEAVAYFEVKVLHQDDGRRGATADAVELAWTQSALSGQGEAADRQRLSDHDAQQQALLIRARNEAAARELARENASGSPKGEADALIATEVSKGTVISAQFTGYGWDRGFHTAPALSQVPR